MAAADITVTVRIINRTDHCDIETGDLMLPIRNGLFENPGGTVSVLRWRPGDRGRVIFSPSWGGPITFKVGRYAGGWCYYQVDPPCCPFGRDEYENMAYTLARGYIWPETQVE